MKRLLPLLIIVSCAPAQGPELLDQSQARLRAEARRLCRDIESNEPSAHDRAQAALRDFCWVNPQARRAVEAEAAACRSEQGRADIKAATRRLKLLDPPDGYYWIRVAPSGIDGVFKAVAACEDPLQKPTAMHVLVDLSTGSTNFFPEAGEAAPPLVDPVESKWSPDPRLSAATREKYKGLLLEGLNTRSALIQSVAGEDTGLRADRLNVAAGGTRIVAWEDSPRLGTAGRSGHAPVAAWQGLHDTQWIRVPTPPLDGWWEAKASDEFVTLWNGMSAKGAVYSFDLGAWTEISIPPDAGFSALTRAAGRCVVSAGYETVAAYANSDAAWNVLPVPAPSLLPYKIDLMEGPLLSVATVQRSNQGRAAKPADWRLEIVLIDQSGP